MKNYRLDPKELIDELSSAQLTYYRPEVQVMKYRYSNDDYESGCYVISDSDYEDYGGFAVETASFPVFWFDWYLGCWNTNDADLLCTLSVPEVKTALAKLVGDITVSKEEIDRTFWKTIISLCLKGDVSLVNDPNLKVVYERENAAAKHPAVFPADNYDDWQSTPTFASFLSSHKPIR